jgi:hypothetical protein
MNPIVLDAINQDIKMSSYFKFLRLRTHKYNGFTYIEIPEEKSTIKDIVNLAFKFYNSPVDYLILITLPYDDLKKKAAVMYQNKGYVLWKDIVGTCKFKELIADCTHEKAIELVLDFNI